MIIVVSGGNGFVGSHLVKQLVKNPQNSVYAMIQRGSNKDRLKDQAKRYTFIETDYLDVKVAFDQVEEGMVDVFYHLAWIGVDRKSRNHPMQWENQRLMGFALDFSKKANVKRFIALGSQAEYGYQNSRIDESFPVRPLTQYAKAKVDCNQQGQVFCKKNKIEFVWIRLFSTFGPMDNPNWMIPYVINCYINHLSPSLTSGTQYWDYLYICELAKALELVSKCSSQGVFNLGSGKPHQIKKIVSYLYHKIQPKVSLVFGQLAERKESVMMQACMKNFSDAFFLQPANRYLGRAG